MQYGETLVRKSEMMNKIFSSSGSKNTELTHFWLEVCHVFHNIIFIVIQIMQSLANRLFRLCLSLACKLKRNDKQSGITVDQHTVYRSTYSISIDILYVNWYTRMYVDWHTVCQSTYTLNTELGYLIIFSLTQFYKPKRIQCNYWQNGEKNAYILIFVPKCSIIAF